MKSLNYIFLVMLFSLLSCSQNSDRGDLMLAFQTEPTTLDPAFAVDYSSGLVASLIHSNLVCFDVDGRIRADAAGSWDVLNSGREYVFHLKHGRFSSGSRVKAEDVAFSFERLLSPDVHSPRWWILKDVTGAEDFHSGQKSTVDGIEVIDDSTLSITLERPVAYFLDLIAMPSCGIVSKDAVEKEGSAYGRRPIGSGPWALYSWKEGDLLRLVRNPYYGGYGVAKQSVGGITFRILPESMTRVAEFEVGNLDVLEVPRAELNRWKSSRAKVLSREELRIVYIGLNNRRPPFNDVRVRRALNMAVDVQSIIEHVLFGAAVKADGIVPPGLRDGMQPVDGYRYDPEEARLLLGEAGYEDGFEMENWQRENPEGGRILESIQGYLARVGVKVRIVTREWGAFKEAVDKGTPDAFYLDWFADYPDAENFLFPLFHSANIGGKGNRAAYRNSVVDSLLDEASMTCNAARRSVLYLEAERIIYDEAPWIFLWFPVKYEVVSKRLEGYRIPLIFNGQRFLDVEIK
ncbi:hypothetical protein DRQ05_01175 [bacterium]|nr:MAG: hypothetical protein DRQ05_01175 [bacterium]